MTSPNEFCARCVPWAARSSDGVLAVAPMASSSQGASNDSGVQRARQRTQACNWRDGETPSLLRQQARRTACDMRAPGATARRRRYYGNWREARPWRDGETPSLLWQLARRTTSESIHHRHLYHPGISISIANLENLLSEDCSKHILSASYIHRQF